MGIKGALKNVSKETLEELYWGQRLSCRQIGEILGKTSASILWDMKKYEIPRRSLSEANKGMTNWAKGLTKETHPGIANRAKKISGIGNPNFGKRGSAYHWYGRQHSGETKRKMSEVQQGPKSPNYGRRPTAETRHKLSASRTGSKNPQFGRTRTDEEKQNLSQKISSLWQNPEYVARMMKLRQAKPNKQEQILISVLSKEFPQFAYNGDFSQGVMLSGLIPDFINVNGQKEVIELYGDYWHSKDGTRWRQTELGRIMTYNSVGYHCLVIWQSELKNPDKVIEKIRVFTSPSRR